MSLPRVLEIVPVGNPSGFRFTVPGSKSITQPRIDPRRPLPTAKTTLDGALWSEDTQVVMVECLYKLEFSSQC
jgi:5-enolpyruvylshikimate-3-phosphate synthase